MPIRIRNQKNSYHTLGLSTPAWWEMLKLALKNGWQPLGSVVSELSSAGRLQADFLVQEQEPDWLSGLFVANRPEALLDTYLPAQPDDGGAQADGSRLVLLEDALNFVDALDKAYQAYEPVRLPASYFLFEPDDPRWSRRPSLGALAAAIEVCRQGSFSIEPWRTRG